MVSYLYKFYRIVRGKVFTPGGKDIAPEGKKFSPAGKDFTPEVLPIFLAIIPARRTSLPSAGPPP